LWELMRRGNLAIIPETFWFIKNGTSSYWDMNSVSRYLPSTLRGPLSLTSRVCTSEFRKQFDQTKAGLGLTENLAERQKRDLTQLSIPSLLHHEDRTSMAHSIETRLPFLDYELVEFAVNCEPSLKLHRGWSKWILRNSMSG